MLEAYRYIERFRVPFADIDMLRHVNNAAYVRWMESARSNYFADVLTEEITGERGIIMGTMEVVYEAAALYREHVSIGCRVSRFGSKSFDFEYEVWSEDRTLRCVRAKTVIVAMNYATGETIAIPPEWRDRVATFEPQPP